LAEGHGDDIFPLGVMAHRDLEGAHVLVVEDTEDSRELLKIVLEYCGALVTAAESAERAKRILETLHPTSSSRTLPCPTTGSR
jgi:PleD family two-component response regulator